MGDCKSASKLEIQVKTDGSGLCGQQMKAERMGREELDATLFRRHESRERKKEEKTNAAA